jgi:hypothetical protein
MLELGIKEDAESTSLVYDHRYAPSLPLYFPELHRARHHKRYILFGLGFGRPDGQLEWLLFLNPFAAVPTLNISGRHSPSSYLRC